MAEKKSEKEMLGNIQKDTQRDIRKFIILDMSGSWNVSNHERNHGGRGRERRVKSSSHSTIANVGYAVS